MQKSEVRIPYLAGVNYLDFDTLVLFTMTSMQHYLPDCPFEVITFSSL